MSYAVMWILDGAIGDPFDNTVKGILCLLLFIVHLIYLLYVVVAHMALIYSEVRNIIYKIMGSKKEGEGELPSSSSSSSSSSLQIWDVFNIFLGNGLVWPWIFISLFYFDETFYQTNMIIESRRFFEISTRMWAFSILVGNGVGYGITIPVYVLVEFFSAWNVITTQFIYIVLFGGLLSRVMDKTTSEIVLTKNNSTTTTSHIKIPFMVNKTKNL